MNILVVAECSTLSMLVMRQLAALSANALYMTCVRNTQGSWAISNLLRGSFLSTLCRITFTSICIARRKHQVTKLPQILPCHLLPSHQHHQNHLYALNVYTHKVGQALRLTVINSSHITNAANDYRIRHLLQHAIPPNWSLWLKDYLAGFYVSQLPEPLDYWNLLRN